MNIGDKNVSKILNLLVLSLYFPQRFQMMLPRFPLWLLGILRLEVYFVSFFII